jgi:hypothetical protein
MQICSVCHTQSVDSALNCPSCNSLLSKTSEQAVALIKYQNNSRVQSLRVASSGDCCPACRKVEGNYAKDKTPVLPVVGCSHENGCRCFYEPILSEIYP